MPPLSTVQSLPEGALNLADLNLHIALQIVSKAGRGAPFTYALAFDSDVWTPVTNSTWIPAFNWGWTTETDAFTGYVTYQASPQQCAYGASYPPQMYNFTLYEDFIYYDQAGAAHPFNMQPLQYPTGLPCGPNYASSGSATTTDGSGLTLYAEDNYGGTPGATVVPRTGAHLSPPVYLAGSEAANGAASFVDPNGNEITTNGSTFTDTLGVAELTVSGSGTPSSPLQLTYPGPSANETATVNYSSKNVSTAFGCNKNYSGTASLPTSVVLANGSTFKFAYAGDGRLDSLTLPTGAVIAYAYSGGSGGINCQDGSPNTLTRTVNGDTWEYVHTFLGNGDSQTVATDPAGNVTTYTFSNDYEVERIVDQGSGTTLETVYTCYNGSNCAASGGTGGFTLPITSRAVITKLPNSQENETVTNYDGYGDPTEVVQYDWSASGPPAAILRKTLISYAALTGIAGRPGEVEVLDGSDNLIADTTYAYDQTALQSTSGLPQHISAPNSSRGNLTTAQACASLSGGTCTRTLTSKYSYFDTGEVYQATAPNSATTTYSYSGGGACAGAFPTTVTLPQDAQGSAYSLEDTWNCNGGVLSSATSLSGYVTDYSYSDPLWRLTGVADPDGGGEKIQYPSPNETETITTITPSLSETQYSILDNLGRPSFAQTADGSACDTVQTTYDPVHGKTSVSQPYSATCQSPGAGAAFTTTAVDALGRPQTITAPNSAVTNFTYTGAAVTVTGPTGVTRILQANGLGELADVCEVTNLSGSTNCNLDAGGTGYLTAYAYDALGDLTSVDEAGQTRSFTFDALGRMLTETTPESGQTALTYGTDSTCGTTLGSLVKRVDNMGNVTCLAYDQLGRVTAITYPSGPYASATPSKTFVYDAATVDGQNMVNAAGELAEAYTGPSGAKITDEGFTYDSMGRPTELFESAPGSGGYYESQESYWPDGQRETLTLPGVPVITYNLNALGEVTSVDAASGQDPVTTASYNANNDIGDLTGITFGSGDSDGDSYNTETGRMTTYSLGINGQTETGTLTWNTDGTLASLDISDPFDAGDTQNCAFTHDDLGRLASVNCGAEWSQTFSTDAFGDTAVTAGNDAFPASFSNDRISSVNGFAPNYDLDGNLLDNPVAQTRSVYGWDAAGRPVKVDGVSQTFDALGRLVYNTVSPAQFLWTPDGDKIADMGGQNLNFALIPLPGGAVANYTGAGLTYYAHADWEGSWRLDSTPSRSKYGDVAYSPFGIGYAGSGPGDFAGHWGDTPDNLFDSPNRLLAPMMARWLSPDPAGLAAVNPANPQSWNAYAYVANQPLAFTDPLGLGSGCGPIPGTEPPPNAVYSCPGGWVGVPFTFYTQGVAYPPVPPMWEMGCDGGCISGILAAQAAGLLSLADNFASGLGGYTNAPGSSGGGGINAGTTQIGSSLLQCTADHAQDWSLAGVLGHIPGLNHGVGGFIVNMLGGNTFSAATDLATSIVSGQAGGHSVFYHMGLSVAAGPAQGFKPVLDALGMSVDNARGLLEGGLTAAAGEWATGIGEAKFGLDLATFIGAGAACVAGFVR